MLYMRIFFLELHNPNLAGGGGGYPNNYDNWECQVRMKPKRFEETLSLCQNIL